MNSIMDKYKANGDVKTIRDRINLFGDYFHYRYDPEGVYSEFINALANILEIRKDSFPCPLPFSVDDIEHFLEMTVSSCFFIFKNEEFFNFFLNFKNSCACSSTKGPFAHTLPLKYSFEISLDSSLFTNSKLERECLETRISFIPSIKVIHGSKGFTDERDLYFSASLRDLSDDKEDNEIFHKGKILKYTNTIEGETSIDGFTEKHIKNMKFFPRDVGYSHENNFISLKNFKLDRHLRLEDYPLYLDIPYIREYIAYKCCKGG